MSNPTAGSQMVQPPRETVRKEGGSLPTSRVYPRIYAGVCEKCGIVDDQSPEQFQYKLCEHYRGLTLECMYCDPTRNPKDVTSISELKVFDHPYKRDALQRPLMAVVCNSFTCTDQFLKEFGR